MATAWGGPAGSGRIRVEPDDFVVEEVLGFEPGGGGEHAWLWVRKRGANTADVAAALARRAGVAVRRVGFSGRKDRNAVTAQWFSVQLPGATDPDWLDSGDERWCVERALRHPRKLRTGTHRGNRFALRVRALDADPEGLEARLRRVAAEGFPNYFGPQRFGHRGENLRRARERLAGDARPGRGHGLELSAARSWLFNRVLDRRVAEASWNVPLPGDALMLAGSRSLFEHGGDDPEVPARVAAHDLDVTGPLWGRGRLPVGAAVAAREAAWLADEAALRAGIERAGVRAARRALRARAEALEWSRAGDTLTLRFVLERGVFATSLLRELLETDGGDA